MAEKGEDRSMKWLLLLLCVCHLINVSDANHPMLYFTSEDVPKLRHKAKTTHIKIAKILEEAGRSLKEDEKLYLPPESFEKFGSRWNELYGNNLCAFAMYCLLNPQDKKAFELVQLYMDRMTSYPDWYVTSSRNVDQVPIGHSLTGYATALDFLYPYFSKSRVKHYLKKIRTEVEALYQILVKKRAGWAKQFIHNHAPTNVLAMLLGAMVYEVHSPTTAKPWKDAAIGLFEKSMELYSYIVDGSCDEGVAYGSYTSKGITQYIYLAKRHFNRDHTKLRWLREHFWFFYATTMPGFQRTVGIADSNHNWFYGPESQLVFLDAFVLKNGYGNWLADRVRSAKPKNPPLARSMSQRWSTVHTEFLFYDASIKAVRPVLPSNTSLHTFHDWGVVTYGGGQYLKKGNTFLSFKSGAVHGEAVADIVNYKLLQHIVNGWTNFNAGHEHPDQNSFVFAPNGRYFVTEALYSPKHTYLNNVLTFAPSESSKCSPPWEGQLGECSKWLAYKQEPVPRGKIISVTMSADNIVHIAGESANAYREELGIESAQRSLFLLNSEALVLIDSVYLDPESDLLRASAYFHNIMHSFHPYRHLGLQGAQVIYPEGPYAFFWLRDDGISPTAQLYNQQANPSEYKDRTTSFVNVTYTLRGEGVTRMAYVFIGPNTKVQAVSFDKESNNDVACFKIVMNDIEYKITLASTSLPLDKRTKLLRFGGYATIQTGDTIRHMGLAAKPEPTNRCDVTDDVKALRFVRSLISSSNQTIMIEPEEEPTVATQTSSASQSYLIIVIALIFIYLFARRRSFSRWKLLIALMLTWCILSWYYLCGSCPQEVEVRRSVCEIVEPIESNDVHRPATVIIASLPGSGAELLESIFYNSSDFLYFTSDDVKIPRSTGVSSEYEACYWPKDRGDPVTAGWLRVMSTEPLLFLNNLPEGNSRIENLRRKLRQMKKKARFAVNLLSGYWNSKVTWLKEILEKNMRLIVVVRDPHDWIHSLTRDDLTGERKIEQARMRKFLLSKFTCLPPSVLPREFQNIKKGNDVERLSKLWVASIASLIRYGRSMQIVRFEDLVSNPEVASTKIYQGLGMTISVPQINKITRAVRSGDTRLGHEDILVEKSVGQWHRGMEYADAFVVERVCKNLMRKLGYL
ncbi:dermatan-sulfate epimerase-like protein [Clavelina lepadiformis]|uniref:dermatan-sulfate epimerase-like protein n=1 Tax=Clavelina lepadiformis TaxID=159417 RepID=UPI004041405B